MQHFLLEEEEEGLHGVFKRLRRNGHQLKREAANSSTLTVTRGRLNPQNSQNFLKKKRGYTVCSSGYAATDTS
jgi:hypothetical protein